VRLLAAARWRLRAWLGDERVGMLDYWRRPGWRASWGGPFNGQAFRQQLFVELCSRVPFVAVVETGTALDASRSHCLGTPRWWLNHWGKSLIAFDGKPPSVATILIRL